MVFWSCRPPHSGGFNRRNKRWKIRARPQVQWKVKRAGKDRETTLRTEVLPLGTDRPALLTYLSTRVRAPLIYEHPKALSFHDCLTV